MHKLHNGTCLPYKQSCNLFLDIRANDTDVFRYHLHALAADDPCAAKLAAVLGNVHAYYCQFVPHIQDAIAVGMSPLEKQLKVETLHAVTRGNI